MWSECNCVCCKDQVEKYEKVVCSFHFILCGLEFFILRLVEFDEDFGGEVGFWCGDWVLVGLKFFWISGGGINGVFGLYGCN